MVARPTVMPSGKGDSLTPETSEPPLSKASSFRPKPFQEHLRSSKDTKLTVRRAYFRDARSVRKRQRPGHFQKLIEGRTQSVKTIIPRNSRRTVQVLTAEFQDKLRDDAFIA